MTRPETDYETGLVKPVQFQIDHRFENCSLFSRISFAIQKGLRRSFLPVYLPLICNWLFWHILHVNQFHEIPVLTVLGPKRSNYNLNLSGKKTRNVHLKVDVLLSPRIKVLRLRYIIIGIYFRNPLWLQSQLHVSNTYQPSFLAKTRYGSDL